MKIWKKISLKWKIAIFVGLITTIVTSLAIAIYLYSDIQRLKTLTTSNTEVQAKWIGENCALSLEFDYPDRAADVINKLNTMPLVTECAIYTVKGKIHASYSQAGLKQNIPPLPKTIANEMTGNHLKVYQPIVYKDRILGIVYLKVVTNIEQHIRDRLVVMLLILFGTLLLTILLTSIFQQVISNPILNLANIIGKVSAKGDYGVRVRKENDDEIGILYDEFNDMLDVIQKRQMERDIAEAEIIELNQQLEKRVAERTRRLESANRELNELAYISAHDLKTPLRGIGQLASWLSIDYKNSFDEAGKGQIDLLMNRVNRMNNLVNGMLRYTLISRFDIKRTPVSIYSLITEILSEINHPDDLNVDIAPDIPTIYGDKNHFKALFSSLIENAVQFSNKPQGWVQIRFKDIEGYFQFEIEDNGCGIEEKYFEKIFKIFQTLSSGYENERTGIGLPLAKKIIEMYDGDIWLESTVNLGTTVFFTLKKI
jgi:signal transduction histidine kinase